MSAECADNSERVRWKPKNPPLRKGERVCDVGAPKRTGIIINVGLQISEVKWPNGHHQYVSNDYLRRVDP